MAMNECCPLCGFAAEKCGELPISEYEWETRNVADLGFMANWGREQGRPWKVFKIVNYFGKDTAVLFRPLGTDLTPATGAPGGTDEIAGARKDKDSNDSVGVKEK